MSTKYNPYAKGNPFQLDTFVNPYENKNLVDDTRSSLHPDEAQASDDESDDTESD